MSYSSGPHDVPSGLVLFLILLTASSSCGAGILWGRESPDMMDRVRAFQAACRDTVVRPSWSGAALVCPNQRHTLRVLGPDSVLCACPTPSASGSAAP